MIPPLILHGISVEVVVTGDSDEGFAIGSGSALEVSRRGQVLLGVSVFNSRNEVEDDEMIL
jgi:hypothetical protein